MKYNHLLFPISFLVALVWGCFFSNPLPSRGQQPDPPQTVDLPNFVKPHQGSPGPVAKPRGTTPQITVWVANDKTHPNIQYYITDADGQHETHDPGHHDYSSQLFSTIFQGYITLKNVQTADGKTEVEISGNDKNGPVAFVSHCYNPNKDHYDVGWSP